MTKCYLDPTRFSSVQRRKMEAAFSGGAITGNGGIPLLAEVDRQLDLTRSVSRYLGMHGAKPGPASTVYRICSGSACMRWHWDTRSCATTRPCRRRPPGSLHRRKSLIHFLG